MATREELLRRLLDATDARVLTDDQRRELAHHLEDSVDAKIRAGMPEVEAITQAFEDLGNITKVVQRYPRTLITLSLEEAQFLSNTRGLAITTLVMLAIVQLTLMFALPKFNNVFLELNTPLPTLTLLTLNISSFMKNFWFLTLPLFAGLLWVSWRFASHRLARPVLIGARVTVSLLFMFIIIAMFLPLFSLLECIGG